jgi:multidrug efflux pump subunit AcrB
MGSFEMFIRRPSITTVTILLALVVGIYSYLSTASRSYEVVIPIVVVSTFTRRRSIGDRVAR